MCRVKLHIDLANINVICIIKRKSVNISYFNEYNKNSQ